MSVSTARAPRLAQPLYIYAAALAAHALFWLVSEPPVVFSDFYKAYYPAAELLLQNGPFTAWPFAEYGAGGFVNLPIVAYLFVPFTAFGEDAAGIAYLAFGYAVVLATFEFLVRMARVPSYGPGRALVLLALFANGPLVNSVREGNTTHVVLLALVLALLAKRAGRPLAAGALIGLSAIIKLPFLLLVGWIIWKRRWAALLGWATAVATTVAASIACFGFSAHADWFAACVVPFTSGVVPAFNVQSIDGFLLRITTGDELLRSWDPIARPAYAALARVICLAGVCGVLVWATQRGQRHRPEERDDIDFALVLLLALTCSPLSWTHYYLFCIIPAALLAPSWLSGAVPAHWSALFIAGFLMTATPVVDFAAFGVLPGLASRTVSSIWLFGGLLMFAALAGICRHTAQNVGGETPALLSARAP